MRIAWITPYLPVPPNSGGRIRILALAEALADEELVLFARQNEFDAAIPRDGARLGPFGAAHTRPGQRTVFQLLPRLPEPARAFPAELSRLVAEAHSRAPWDAVIVEHCFAMGALPRLPGARVILDEHNVESEYFRRQLRSRPLRLPGNGGQWLLWRRFERACWRAADAVTVVSHEDAGSVRRVRPDTGVVFPNGVHPGVYRYVAPSKRPGTRILFLGLMNYEPNIEAAILLAKRILPRVRALVPGATLTLAGRDPAPAVLALASETVHVTGTLESLGPLFDDHAAFAMPIALGAGTSLKALEALAAGLPIVAYPFAMRAHPLTPGVHYLAASGIDGFARSLARILTRKGELDEMARRGRLVAEALSWQAIGRSFADFVRAR